MVRVLLVLVLLAVSVARASSIADFNDLVGIPAWQVERSLGADDRSLQLVIGFADPEVCYPAMEEADANQDGIVDAQEYVTFCKLMGPTGFLEGIDTFEELPLRLQSNFFLLACLCQSDPSDDSCCVGTEGVGIRTDGANEGDVPTPGEESYLFIVCSLTASAIDRVIKSAAPTQSPVTSSPSAMPSETASENPTGAPSAAPSAAATDSPSRSPTASPSVTPGTPTAAPTTAAPTTKSPTEQPTTAAPTKAPEPTTAPQPVEEVVTTVYRIVVESGAEETIYAPQLVDAMDSLAPEVLASILDNNTPRRLQVLLGGSHQRRLQSVGFPTVIDDIQMISKCLDLQSMDGWVDD